MIPVTRQNTRMASALFFLDCPASILSDCFVWCSEEKKKKRSLLCSNFQMNQAFNVMNRNEKEQDFILYLSDIFYSLYAFTKSEVRIVTLISSLHLTKEDAKKWTSRHVGRNTSHLR